MTTKIETQYQHLEPRPGSNYRAVIPQGSADPSGRGRRVRIHGPDPRSPEEFARDFEVPLEAVLEALDYVAQNLPLIQQERDEEAAMLRARGLIGTGGEMRLLLDENMSDRRLASRLRALAHDPLLAVDVGLTSSSDPRVLIWAIAQAVPVLTTGCSSDFTDLHDLIMAAAGHHSGVLIVRFDDRPTPQPDRSWHRQCDQEARGRQAFPSPIRFTC